MLRTPDITRSSVHLVSWTKTISMEEFLECWFVSIDRPRHEWKKGSTWPLRRYTFLGLSKNSFRDSISLLCSRDLGKRSSPLFDSNFFSSIDASHSQNYSLKRQLHTEQGRLDVAIIQPEVETSRDFKENEMVEVTGGNVRADVATIHST